jgi:hypothetical protein
VTSRFITIGLVSLALAVLAEVALYVRPHRPGAPSRPTPSDVRANADEAGVVMAAAEASDDTRAETESETWTVLGAMSAHGALVVDVAARHPEKAGEIAVQIVEPVRSRNYEEILIYFHPADRPAADAVRRVQWTPRGGFIEAIYEQAP